MEISSKNLARKDLQEAKAMTYKANECYAALLKSYIEKYYVGRVDLENRILMVAELLENASEEGHWPDVTPSEVDVLEVILENYC